MDTAAWYRRFAQVEAQDSSPIYHLLANRVADDGFLIEQLERLPIPKRQPNLLFASVRFLDGPISCWSEFRSFVTERWEDIAQLMRTRSTQTNEAGRCSALLPVLGSLGAPIALIEVGASAGLCLFPDRYSYSYNYSNGGTVVGNSRLRIEVASSGPVPIPTELPDICWRRGIDLNPLDVTQASDIAWLRACIWPEHHERTRRLDIAAQIAAQDPPTIVRGDLNAEIDELLDSAPSHAIKVVFHSAVLAYLTPEQRHRFMEKMKKHQEVVWISNEAPGIVADLVAPHPAPTPNAFILGRNGTEVLAHSDPHGQWLSWSPSN